MSTRGSHASHAENAYKQRKTPDDWNHRETSSHQKDIIHLMYVRIPDKGIKHVFTIIHLMYVRIPCKGITMFWLAYI
jgi:hypothetical protein